LLGNRVNTLWTLIGLNPRFQAPDGIKISKA
jgi:hypothetical protein